MTVDNLTNLWIDVLKSVSKQVKKTDFLVWFQDTNILSQNEQNTVVGVPSIFAKDWFEKKYKDFICDELKSLGHNQPVEFAIDTTLKSDSKGVDVTSILDSSKRKARKISNRNEISYKFTNAAGQDNVIVSKMLNPKYQLSNLR